MLVLSDSEVTELLTHARAREAVRTGAREHAAGATVSPRRMALDLPEHNELLVMPGMLTGAGVLGLKTVGEYPANPGAGLPVAPSVLLLLDAATGMPAALMNATELTLRRTAAMTVVAAEHLAVPEPRSLAVIGAGGQALAHIEAFADRYALKRVRVSSRTAARAEQMAAIAADMLPGFDVEVCATAEEAAAGAEIVVCATTASAPVVAAGAIGPGQLLCSVGTNRPHEAELPLEAVARAERLVVDTRTGGYHGAYDVRQAVEECRVPESAVAELGELVTGAAPGRTAQDQLTVFKSVGFSALDLAAGAMVLDLARQACLGSELEF